MNFSFNRTVRRAAALLAAAVVLSPLACARHGAADAEETRTRAAEIIGILKLVRQEYVNAVAPDGGRVIDPTEYGETELFAEQAQAKLPQLERTAALAGSERGRAIRDGVARVRDAVGRKAPPSEVGHEAAATIAVVEELLAGAVPEQIRGAVVATARADEAIAAEEIVDEYRIGVTSGPGRTIFRRVDSALVPEPARAGEIYVAALVREKRTKRFLPAEAVKLTIAGGGRTVAADLAELWGEFHQYGGNVAPPVAQGPVTVTIAVSPPAYARHGDMLTHFVKPATATLHGEMRDGTLHFDARPVQPVDDDYRVGDDLLQATAEAGTLHDAGPYRVGVIVEGPEPIWTWHEGAPVLEPVSAAATNHVEVVVVDRETGQLVPDADVRLTFRGDGRDVGTATLHPLLSVFSHYGETLQLPPAASAVRIHVGAPALGSVDRPRLVDGAEIELPLPKKRTS